MSIITIPKPNPDAKLQLFCIPFAGGGTKTFFNWYKQKKYYSVISENKI
jgi:surfactin synthase thioesterase subunit